jgi:hypothetical protein
MRHPLLSRVVSCALGALCVAACSSPTSPSRASSGATGASSGSVGATNSGGDDEAGSVSGSGASVSAGSGASAGAGAAAGSTSASAGSVVSSGTSGSTVAVGSSGSNVSLDGGEAVVPLGPGETPSGDAGLLCCHVSAEDENCYGTAYYQKTAIVSCNEVVTTDASTYLLTWTCSSGEAGAASETSPFCASPDCTIGSVCNLGIPPATICLGTVEACP